MRFGRLSFSIVVALSFAGCASSGAYGPSSDERLETSVREALGSGPQVDLRELEDKRCTSFAEPLAKALNENLPDEERLAIYTKLYEQFKATRDALELGLKRNPDLAYDSGEESKPGAQLAAALRACEDAVATIEGEFERYVRELTEMPTVTDVHGQKNARLDFATLIAAVELLDPTDKLELLDQVERAETTLKNQPPPEPKPAKKKRRSRKRR